MLVDVKWHWFDVRTDKSDNNEGYHYGIHTHEVNADDIDTDEMFYDADIVDVQWFKTEKERDNNFKDKSYKTI